MHLFPHGTSGMFSQKVFTYWKSIGPVLATKIRSPSEDAVQNFIQNDMTEGRLFFKILSPIYTSLFLNKPFYSVAHYFL